MEKETIEADVYEFREVSFMERLGVTELFESVRDVTFIKGKWRVNLFRIYKGAEKHRYFYSEMELAARLGIPLDRRISEITVHGKKGYIHVTLVPDCADRAEAIARIVAAQRKWGITEDEIMKEMTLQALTGKEEPGD